ncbi:nitroreductase family protein [Cohnella xylanilytica]|uniref:Nitroreductase family protein n=1 Tax=Cohnella xylanilytica TaxID=557555 RepID=A0A841U2F2_9BACL|nr:nitroreductase family protein [Cohnella xylanilytica]MBB6694917.1 nitroreductase family protein [Cohnella xylanilytica]
MTWADRTIPDSKRLRYRSGPVPQPIVLELLNHAVWAPNHGLREPWRFIFVDNGKGDALGKAQEPAPAYLVVAMKEEANPYKRHEDFAAVCCLVQNFRLLAWERQLGVRATRPEWTDDPLRRRSFGIRETESIAFVLEMGFVDPPPPESASSAAAPAPAGLAFELF